MTPGAKRHFLTEAAAALSRMAWPLERSSLRFFTCPISSTRTSSITVPCKPFFRARRGYRGTEFLTYNGRAIFTAAVAGAPSGREISAAGTALLKPGEGRGLFFGKFSAAFVDSAARTGAGEGCGRLTGFDREISAAGFVRVSRLRLFLGLCGRSVFLGLGGITGALVFSAACGFGGGADFFSGLTAGVVSVFRPARALSACG